jgi:hypothetical protein
VPAPVERLVRFVVLARGQQRAHPLQRDARAQQHRRCVAQRAHGDEIVARDRRQRPGCIPERHETEDAGRHGQRDEYQQDARQHRANGPLLQHRILQGGSECA